MPEPDLATPIDAPLQWPEPPETVEPTRRRIHTRRWPRVFSGRRNLPYVFRWMEDDPHEPIGLEEIESLSWHTEPPARQVENARDQSERREAEQRRHRGDLFHSLRKRTWSREILVAAQRLAECAHELEPWRVAARVERIEGLIERYERIYGEEP